MRKTTLAGAATAAVIGFFYPEAAATVSVCTAVPWFITCRKPNKIRNPLKPIKKIISRP